MKSFQIVSAFFGALVLVAACSSGGARRVAGQQCPQNYQPILVGDKAQSEAKLWKGEANESMIPAGNYAYERADVIYTEKGLDGLVIHLQEGRLKDGSFHASVNCVRNSKNLEDKISSLSAVLAGKIVAKPNLPSEVEPRELGLKVVEGRLTPESKPLEKTDSVRKVYEGKATEFFMIENPNKVDYEIRSTFSNNQGDYVVSVKFKRTP